MTQTLNRHGSRLVILPPSGVWVVVMAAIGMMIVVAPRELVEAAGLLGLRRAYDHAFGVLVLLLTAWASWIVAGQAAVSHARSVFLNRIPVIFDRASTSERRLVMECVAQGGVPFLLLRGPGGAPMPAFLVGGGRSRIATFICCAPMSIRTVAGRLRAVATRKVVAVSVGSVLDCPTTTLVHRRTRRSPTQAPVTYQNAA
jgi:hypothetical protein